MVFDVFGVVWYVRGWRGEVILRLCTDFFTLSGAWGDLDPFCMQMQTNWASFTFRTDPVSE